MPCIIIAYIYIVSHYYIERLERSAQTGPVRDCSYNVQRSTATPDYENFPLLRMHVYCYISYTFIHMHALRV